MERENRSPNYQAKCSHGGLHRPVSTRGGLPDQKWKSNCTPTVLGRMRTLKSGDWLLAMPRTASRSLFRLSAKMPAVQLRGDSSISRALVTRRSLLLTETLAA